MGKSEVVELLVAFLLIQIYAGQPQQTSCEFDLESYRCQFVDPNNTARNRTKELICCNLTVQSFYLNWMEGSLYLSTFLNTLKTWNCPQFVSECQRQSFAVTAFTKLLYATLCNHSTAVQSVCGDEVENKQSKVLNFNGNKSIQDMDFDTLSDSELTNPCVQLTTFELDKRPGHFFEIAVIVPFCGITWCGFNENIFMSKIISPWTCIENSCRATVLAIAVLSVTISLCIVVCNVMILAVFFHYKQTHNAHAIFRISLAFADLLVGVFVFPTFINQYLRYFSRPLQHGVLTHITSYAPAYNNSLLFQASSHEIRKQPITFCNSYSYYYIGIVGFVTLLSIGVSTDTLVLASVDRFVAVFKPLKYKTCSPRTIAKKAIIFSWIFAAIFASLPFFITNMRYEFRFSTLPIPMGAFGKVVTSAFIFFLLVVMWAINFATIKAFQKHEKTSNFLRQNSDSSAKSRNLIIILSIMVGVFSICLLPIPVILIHRYYKMVNITDSQQSFNKLYVLGLASAEVFSTILIFSNSLCNFFIYSARDKTFRNRTVQLFIRCNRTKSCRLRSRSTGNK